MTMRYSTRLRNELLGINTELVTNGALDTVTTGWTGWTAGGGASLSIVAANLNIAAGANANAGQQVAAPQGHPCSVAFNYLVEAGGSCKVVVRSADATAHDTGGVVLYDSGILGAAAETAVRGAFYLPADIAALGHVHVYLVNLSGAHYARFGDVAIADLAHSFQEIFKGAKILIYQGTQPTSADAAHSSTLLATITVGAAAGTYLTFGEPANGAIGKNPNETWSGAIVAGGTANWFRLCRHDDTGADDVTNKAFARVDGSIGTSGANMNLSSVAFAQGATVSVTTFTLTFPSQS